MEAFVYPGTQSVVVVTHFINKLNSINSTSEAQSEKDNKPHVHILEKSYGDKKYKQEKYKQFGKH